MNGFVNQALSRGEGVPEREQPGVRELSEPRRDGVPHAERHPELLVVRAELRAPGPHVRAERLLEPPRASLPGVGVVGEVHPARHAVELHERARGARAPARLPRERRRGADLRLDRPHVPAAQEQRAVGLLRRDRDRAGLRERRRGHVRAGPPELVHTGHLEPAAPTSTRSATTGSSATSRRSRTSTRPPSAAPFPRSRGSSPRAR